MLFEKTREQLAEVFVMFGDNGLTERSHQRWLSSHQQATPLRERTVKQLSIEQNLTKTKSQPPRQSLSPKTHH